MIQINLFNRLFKLLKPLKLFFFAVVIGLILSAILEAAFAYCIKPATHYFLNSNKHSHPDWVLNIPFVLIGFSFLRAALLFVVSYGSSCISEFIIAKLRNQVFSKTLLLSDEAFRSRSSGEILTKMTYNLSIIANFSGKQLVTILQNFALVIGMLVALLCLAFKLTLIISLSALPIVFVVKKTAFKKKILSFIQQDNMENLTEKIHNFIQCFQVIKFYDTQHKFADEFTRITNKVKNVNLKAARLIGLTRILNHTFIILPVALLIYLMINEYISLDISRFIAIVLALLRIQNPLRKLFAFSGVFQEVEVALATLFELFDIPNERVDGAEISPSKNGYNISLEKISYSFDNSDMILKNLSIKVSQGEKIALVGTSGAGKSTLLKILSSILLPTSGDIAINNQKYTDVDLVHLRKKILYVSQNTAILDATIADNISMGLALPMSEIENAARLVSIHDFIMSLPMQYETKLNQLDKKMSGGQQQRIAIARAIARSNASAYLFDEITSALDYETESLVMQNIMANCNQTCIFIAHRLHSIQNIPRILVMDQGEIIADGSHTYLLEHCQHYAQLFSKGLNT